MNHRIATWCLALFSTLAAITLPAAAAPTLTWQAPAQGGTLSGNVQGPPDCIVTGNNIARVMFYLNGVWTNTDGNLSNGLGCWIDTTKYSNGTYTVKAVAYDSAGETTEASRTVVIRNSSASSTSPSIAWQAPAPGGALSGDVKGPPDCIVTGTNISKVMFYLNGTLINTDGNLSNGLGCWVDTRKYADGNYTLKAVAYNAAGDTAQASRSIVIDNNDDNSSGGATSTAPTIAWQAPASGGTLSGNVQGPPNCTVTGTNISKVMFYLNGTWTNTDGNLSNGLGCWIDTTKYANGTYTVKAVAYNSAGQTAEASRTIVINNSTASSTAPTIAWQAPASGGTLSGNVQGPPNCIVTGTNISKVMFYLNGTLTNTDGNLSNGLGCWIDTTKYANGTYTVKAVAYNATGQTAEASRSIVIKNAANAAPSVAFTAPSAGAIISGTATAAASASDNGGSVSKVDLYVDSKMVQTKTAVPYTFSFDTKQFADGSHNLMAVATDNLGAAASAQRTVTVKNAATPTPPDSASIDPADLIAWASGDVPFAQQSGYNAQVMGKFPAANQIPESGITGTLLANGETVRLGKQADPMDSLKKALVFQLAPNDPTTSGSHRSELSFPHQVQFGNVYWAAFKVFIYDWGSLSSSDKSLFGTQLHSGDSAAGYSPSFGIYNSGSNGRNFQIQVRGSGLSGTIRYADQPIPFGRWVDFVFKVRESTGSDGFLQAWMDGVQIVNHSGPIGYKTSYTDYFKFGYYNWSSFNSARKVLLRSPIFVADPTGSKYSAAILRAYINK